MAIRGSDIVRMVEAELSKGMISKTEFYRATGVSSSNMSQWRNNQAYPTPAKLEAMERYLGISFDLAGTKNTPSEEDAVKIREDMFESPEQRILFDASKGAPKSVLLEAAALINRYKEGNK